MQLSEEVHNFARYCERLLSTAAVSRPLTEEEGSEQSTGDLPFQERSPFS
jgi:hypothetical protein